MGESAALLRRLWRRVRDAPKALALQFGLRPAASLLPVIVWVTALLGAVRAALFEIQAALRLFGLVGVVGGCALLTVALIAALAD